MSKFFNPPEEDKVLMRLRHINTPYAHQFPALVAIIDIPIDTPPLCGWVVHYQ